MNYEATSFDYIFGVLFALFVILIGSIGGVKVKRKKEQNKEKAS